MIICSLTHLIINSDMTDYCEKFVDTMGEDAEGTLVELGILPKCLMTSSVIIHLDRRSDVDINVFVNQQENTIGTIHL